MRKNEFVGLDFSLPLERKVGVVLSSLFAGRGFVYNHRKYMLSDDNVVRVEVPHMEEPDSTTVGVDWTFSDFIDVVDRMSDDDILSIEGNVV